MPLHDVDAFFAEQGSLALTPDEVLLMPRFSEVLPAATVLRTQLSKNIELGIPLLSAAMDTVTEEAMAIGMALKGGMGVIHRNLTPTEQARRVRIVKKFRSFRIKPVCVYEHDSMATVRELRSTHKHFSTFPVLAGSRDAEGKKLIGLLAKDEQRFCRDIDQPVSAYMKPLKDLVTLVGDPGVDEAYGYMDAHRVPKLFIVTSDGELTCMYIYKDIDKNKKHAHLHAIDVQGRLRVGAAVGVDRLELERAFLLAEKGVDAIFIDTAHGHTKAVLDMVRILKGESALNGVDIIAGNVATKDGARALCSVGVDAIKVGIGPGSTCTTRIVTRIGVPQLTATYWCASVARNFDIPVIADGGFENSGHMVACLAAGASTIMSGFMFAGTKEACGAERQDQDHQVPLRQYRGMGSIEAMQHNPGSRARYRQGDRRYTPEGMSGFVPARGEVGDEIDKICGGIQSAMGYMGAACIGDMFSLAQFVRITTSGQRESSVHGIML